MGRWEPNARGRLERAALELSARQGYDRTTVAEIAAEAGVTERTFYRYFADKADAFFPDNTHLLTMLADVAAESLAAGHTPLESALDAAARLAEIASMEPERVVLTAKVVPLAPTLTGRDLVRQRQIVDALAATLVSGGTSDLDARLAAETGLAVWRVAVAEWTGAPEGRTLSEVLAATAAGARALSR